MRRIIVKNTNKKYNVISLLNENFPNLSNSSIYKALRGKDIKVNDKRISQNISLLSDDVLDIYISDNLLYGLPKSIDYVYEDENILVAYKPTGILSNSETIDETEPTFFDIVKKDKSFDKDFKICHRLDRNTSGLVIFSKNIATYNEIMTAFKNNRVEKDYLAYVYNAKFSKSHDILEGYIILDKEKEYSKIINESIKNSVKVITEYTVLKANSKKNVAILSVKIHSGKTHQIRAHLASIGHPIIGDGKYGINEVNKKLSITKQMLFAYKLTFNFEKSSFLNYLNNSAIFKYPQDRRIEWLGEI